MSEKKSLEERAKTYLPNSAIQVTFGECENTYVAYWGPYSTYDDSDGDMGSKPRYVSDYIRIGLSREPYPASGGVVPWSDNGSLQKKYRYHATYDDSHFVICADEAEWLFHHIMSQPEKFRFTKRYFDNECRWYIFKDVNGSWLIEDLRKIVTVIYMPNDDYQYLVIKTLRDRYCHVKDVVTTKVGIYHCGPEHTKAQCDVERNRYLGCHYHPSEYHDAYYLWEQHNDKAVSLEASDLFLKDAMRILTGESEFSLWTRIK